MPKSWNVVFMLPMLLSGAARADDRQHTEQLILAPPDNLGTGNCNDDEARQIEYITNDAQWIETSAAGAWDNPQAPNFYNATKKWFGSNGSSAVGAVLGNVQKQLETRNFQFYCNPPDASGGGYNPACDPTDDGLVYDARAEDFSGVPTILVCDAFWGQSNAEQATTILHELTHFAGTDDSVQGEGRAGALALAAADPNAAARSAYNYEFFFGDLGF